MDSPVKDMLDAYCKTSPLRYHMPGHKGKIEINGAHDVTELKQSDDLYDPIGALAIMEDMLACRIGCERVLALTDGSSAGVRIIFMVLAEHCKGKKVLIADDMHRSAIDGCILSGLDAVVVPSQSLYDRLDDTVGGVFITSPSYYGEMADLRSLYARCESLGIILAVDEAHGAHLPYCGLPCAAQIADISVQSMHKTMGALTQSATLCINLPELIITAKYYRRMLCTSSPSFLVLESMEWASNQYIEKVHEFIKRVQELRSYLSLGYANVKTFPIYDPTRLCLQMSPQMTGYRAAEILQEQGIVVEMADNDCIVLILTPHDDDYGRLIDALTSLNDVNGGDYSPLPSAPKPRFVTDMRSAALSYKDFVLPEKAIGKISAACLGAYPPGIPCIYPGCIIDEQTVEYLLAVQGCTEIFGLIDGAIAVVDE